MKKILHLPMSEPWLSMVLSGEKKEEYRDLTHYYASRLIQSYDGKDLSTAMRETYIEGVTIQELVDLYNVYFKRFTHVKLTNGYGNHRPSYLAEFKGIEICTGIEEWGAEPNKKYFVISLGEISERFKC